MTLQDLKSAADAAGNNLDAICKPLFCDGRWGAYRAIECDQKVPETVHAAIDAYLKATHAFYNARDGEDGFLGGH